MYKKLILISFAILIAFTACNNKTSNETGSDAAENSSKMYACPMHPEIMGNKGDKCSKCGMELSVPVDMNATTPPLEAETKTTGTIKEIVGDYLQLKNAFTNDNTNNAATAGKALEAAFKAFDKSALTAEQKKIFEDIEDDAREHAEHIGANSGNIAHQREHFDLLSKDMYDLVKAFGAGQTLYKDFCPMYNDNKGAIWLSETKDIKNPYYGKAMSSCGTVKEELK
ncbi:MAG: DUF3347 domain-containing protein [Sphingobacteriales bacterium]|nr:DUF3347 domain-containing protein [Sphingobacteriales bacterium]